MVCLRFGLFLGPARPEFVILGKIGILYAIKAPETIPVPIGPDSPS